MLFPLQFQVIKELHFVCEFSGLAYTRYERSVIEATIGHMKTDGRGDRNFLKGLAGDAINALLAGAGHNRRLLLNALTNLLARIMNTAIKAAKTVKPSTSMNPACPERSMA
jgi:hypothetical protein